MDTSLDSLGRVELWNTVPLSTTSTSIDIHHFVYYGKIPYESSETNAASYNSMVAANTSALRYANAQNTYKNHQSSILITIYLVQQQKASSTLEN